MTSRDLAIFVTNDLSGICRGRAFSCPGLGPAHGIRRGAGCRPISRSRLLATSAGTRSARWAICACSPIMTAKDSGWRASARNLGSRAFLCDIVETDGRPWGGCPRGFRETGAGRPGGAKRG